MATTGRTGGTPDAIADELRTAPFVRLVSRADGDALAATGLLGRALADRGVPFQASVVRTRTDRATAIEAGDPSDLTVTIGAVDDETDAIEIDPDGPASHRAMTVVRELDGHPDPTLALAGMVAAGETPEEEMSSVVESAPVERRPGVGSPTPDLADGLAHSTWLRASFSGDLEAARNTLTEHDLPAEDDDLGGRPIGSLAAIEGVRGGSPAASTAVERVVRPLVVDDGVFRTVEGYADVLNAAARERPGVGVALALGHDVRASALTVWRAHAAAAHSAADAVETARHAGIVVARIPDDAADSPPAETIARLLCEFASPEPAVAVVGPDAIGVAGIEPDRVAATARAVGAPWEATRTGGYIETADGDEMIEALRGAL